MRGHHLLTVILLGAVVVGACGDGDGDGTQISPTSLVRASETAPPIGTVSTAETAPASGIPATSQPAPTAPTTTSPTQPAEMALAVLRPSGLGSVDFGTPADEAVRMFTEMFGQSDIDDSGDLDCLAMVQDSRTLVYQSLGLTLVFTDWDASTSDPVPLHFASWHMDERAIAADEPLVTAEGIGIGSTAADVRVAYPDAIPVLPDVSNWGFEVRSREGPLSGSFVGPVRPPYYELQPDFVMAVQRALNSHGGSLAVDGEFGPRTTAALEAFAAANGIDLVVRLDAETSSLQFDDPLLRCLWRLGLPEPGDQLWMLWAGQPEVCG